MQTEILTPEIKTKADKIVANYEQRRAALLPVLHLVQESYGFISEKAEMEVAAYIGIPPVDIKEEITFYTLYRSKPCAKHEFNVCRTLSCSLRGQEEIVAHLENKLGIKVGERTTDGQFALNEVECLGACEMAPMMQLGHEYIGLLTKEKIDQILKTYGDGSFCESGDGSFWDRP